jgi:inhibitor of cysteine peptidase
MLQLLKNVSSSLLSLPIVLGAVLVAPAPVGASAVTGGDEVVLTEADDGTTVTVTEGQRLVVALPANPSTGYQWQVTRTDRTFGYPESSFVPEGDRVGAGGIERLTWSTTGGLSMIGEHRVELAYQRAWESTPLTTFSFTVIIASRPVADVTVGPEASGTTVQVRAGARLIVELPSNPSTGYEWTVTRTDRTFGYPETQFVPGDGATGSGGLSQLIWTTSAMMAGSHEFELEYRRPWELDVPPASSFTLRVDVVQ